VDVSSTALSRAQGRLQNFGDRVHLQKLDIVREDLEGTFDLILASEILYYLGGKDLPRESPVLQGSGRSHLSSSSRLHNYSFKKEEMTTLSFF